MSVELGEVGSKSGWVMAALLAVRGFFLKVDEGRIHSALERIEGKVDTLDTKLDDVSLRVVRLEARDEWENPDKQA